jgi:hypothetical protein
MTESEIIEALECCTGKEGGCNGCVFNDEDDIVCWTCEWEMKNAAMEVIKRQQAEIERLKTENAELEAEVDKQYERARADILGNMADGGASCHWCIAEHKKNAIKDFAERTKERVKEAAYEQPDGGYVCESEIVGIINELVAEMEGENGRA